MLSSGTNKAIKANAGDVIRYRNKYEATQNYRTVVRSIISKLPGFYMSNYFQRGGTLTAFVSMPQWLTMITDEFKFHPEQKVRYDELNAMDKFKDGIPKNQLFVRLNPNITPKQRLFVANSLRNYFNDEFTFLLDREDVIVSFRSIFLIFDILIGIVAAIALVITFFLLLVSTR